MRSVRLAISIIVVAGCLLFALQNQATSLSLTFLGLQTVTLPLSLWILAAIAAGALTMLVIISLFQVPFLGRGQRSRRQTRRKRATSNTPPPFAEDFYATEPETDWDAPVPDWEDEQQDLGSERVEPFLDADETAIPEEDASDWFDEDEFSWEEETVPESSHSEPPIQERSIYEVQRSPKTSHHEGSVYSYSYRDAEDSDTEEAENGFQPGSPVSEFAGKPDAVYDANYRVIRPPSEPLPEDEESEFLPEENVMEARDGSEDFTNSEEEDWDNDDWEEEEDRDRQW